jgi:hypothetical protein
MREPGKSTTRATTASIDGGHRRLAPYEKPFCFGTLGGQQGPAALRARRHRTGSSQKNGAANSRDAFCIAARLMLLCIAQEAGFTRQSCPFLRGFCADGKKSIEDLARRS